MAALGAAEYLPPILVGLVAGAWIDRRPRRPVLIATNLARALLLSLVAIAAATHVLRLEVLYVAGIALGTFEVVFTMAFIAYLPSLVEPAALIVANGARATTSAAADVVGPALAGVLIQVFGTAGAVALDASSFLASVGGLALVREHEELPVPPMRRPRIAHDVVEGWRFLLSEPVLRAFTATAFSANFFYRILMAAYVLYLTRDLALSPALIGVIFGLGGGVGVVLGSASAAAVSLRLGLGRSLVAAHALFGAFGLPLALSVVAPQLGVPLVFASEFAQLSVNAIYMVNRTSVEQAITAPRLRGRVQGGRIVSHAVAGTAGLVVGGVLGEQLGTSVPILIGVLGGLTSFVWLLQSPIPELAQIPRTADAPVNDAR
jgi:MFS family permease